MIADQIKAALEAVDALKFEPDLSSVNAMFARQREHAAKHHRAGVLAINLLRDHAIQARLSGEGWSPDREAIIRAMAENAKERGYIDFDRLADAILALAPAPAPREANPWPPIAEGGMAAQAPAMLDEALELVLNTDVRARLLGEGWPPDRVAIARIIDPHHFREIVGLWPPSSQEARQVALAKADAILALAPSNPWRPIAEAPRDGPPILAWCPLPRGVTPFQVVADYYGLGPEDQNGWVAAYDGEDIEPTHFMLLPAPPAEDGEHE